LSDDTTIVIGENDYGRIPEIRPEYFFAGCIEGVGISQGKDRSI
jgi:hypothetical protein